MDLWIKYLLNKHKNWGLNAHNPHKSQVGLVTCLYLQHLGGWDRGSPGKLNSYTSQNWWALSSARDPTSINKVESNWGRCPKSTMGWYVHRIACISTCTCKHSYTHTLTIHIHMEKCPKTNTHLGMAVHTCHPSTWETGGNTSISLRLD